MSFEPRLRVLRGFLYSAGFILLLSGSAKVISSWGQSRILTLPDPVIGLAFRWVFLIVGIAEWTIASYCILSNQIRRSIGCLAWLSTAFLLYRIGLAAVKYHGHCTCLGTLTATLHISEQTADTVMKYAFGYLLLGSYLALFCNLKQKSKLPPFSSTSSALADVL